MPSNERIVEGVFSSSDESSSPVSGKSEINKVLLSLRREETNPVVGVLELRDVFFTNAQLHEDFVLCCHRFALKLLVSGSSVCDLTGEADCRSLDGHTSAMETEGEKHVFTHLFLEADLIFTFRNGISVAYRNNLDKKNTIKEGVKIKSKMTVNKLTKM